MKGQSDLEQIPYQGRRKHLKLGGPRHLVGTFFLTRKEAFFKEGEHISTFIAKSIGARVPVPPAPSSMLHTSEGAPSSQNMPRKCETGVKQTLEFASIIALF